MRFEIAVNFCIYKSLASVNGRVILTGQFLIYLNCRFSGSIVLISLSTLTQKKELPGIAAPEFTQTQL